MKKKTKVEPNKIENMNSANLFMVEYIDYLKKKINILEQIADGVNERVVQKEKE